MFLYECTHKRVDKLISRAGNRIKWEPITSRLQDDGSIVFKVSTIFNWQQQWLPLEFHWWVIVVWSPFFIGVIVIIIIPNQMALVG